MISLILPKLIRSVTRDGIFWLSRMAGDGAGPLFQSTTQGKYAEFTGELA
jgi:hypothetical protein